MQLTGAESLDFRVVAQGLHKEVGGNLRSLQCIKGLHNDNIHLAVLHAGTWSNICIVAILRGVCTSNEESLMMMDAAVVEDFIGLGLILQTLLQHILNISDRTTLTCFCELQRDKGVEAHAAGAKERKSVYDSIIECINTALIDDVNALLHIHRQAQMTGQSVARATGDYGQCRLGVNQSACYLVNCAVTTNSGNNVNMLGC